MNKTKTSKTFLIMALLVFSSLTISVQIKPTGATTITRVQGPFTSATSSDGQLYASLGSPPADGNVVIAVVSASSTTGPIGVLDIQETNVNWTCEIAKRNNTANNYLGIEIWIGIVGAGADNSVTVDLSGFPTLSCAAVDMCEYSGVNILDKTATNLARSSSTADTGITSTTTDASELWVGGTVAFKADSTTPTNGFTLIDGNKSKAALNWTSLAYLEEIVSSTGAANSGITLASTSDLALGCMATFTVGSVGSQNTLIYRLTNLLNTINSYNGFEHEAGISGVDEHIIKYQMGFFTFTQLANWSNYLWNDTSTTPAQTVLYGFAELAKYGIENQTEIKWALDNMTMMNNGLPDTGSSQFAVADRFVLKGYAFALNYAYDLSKWNITKAYANFKWTIDNAPCPATLYVTSTNGTYLYWGSTNPRWYDEAAQTMDCFTTFFEMGRVYGGVNYTDALAEAENVWNWYCNNGWTGSGTSAHFAYYPSVTYWECEAGGFFELALKLYYYDSSLQNSTLLLTDMANRFIASGWSSPQWQTDGGAIIHSYPSNTQTRLENTLMAWDSLYDAWGNFSSHNRTELANMLSSPAWYLLFFNIRLKLYDPGNNLFTMYSDQTLSLDSELLASVYAASLLLLNGIIPYSAELATPIQDYHYEDTNALTDAQLFAINITARNLTLSLLTPGTIEFIYGTTPFSYTFSNNGTYQVTFANDWNSISSITYVGELPTNRLYPYETAPSTWSTYSNVSANSTVWATPCNFTVTINNVESLQPSGEYIFGCNNTGTFTNETTAHFVSTPQTLTITKTLNSTNSHATSPETVRYEWWFSNNDGNWNSTGMSTLTLSWPLTSGLNNVTIYSFDVGHTLGGINASLNYDHIDWTYIIYKNSSVSTQYVFTKASSYNSLITIYQTSGILLVSCNHAGNWTHTYQLQSGTYGSDPTPTIITLAAATNVGVAVYTYRKMKPKKKATQLPERACHP